MFKTGFIKWIDVKTIIQVGNLHTRKQGLELVKEVSGLVTYEKWRTVARLRVIVSAQGVILVSNRIVFLRTCYIVFESIVLLVFDNVFHSYFRFMCDFPVLVSNGKNIRFFL